MTKSKTLNTKHETLASHSDFFHKPSLPQEPPMSFRSRNVLEFTCSPAGLRVDRELGVIYGVKVLGRKSGNGPIYPQSVTSRALPMYEGSKVNLDHPPRMRP